MNLNCEEASMLGIESLLRVRTAYVSVRTDLFANFEGLGGHGEQAELCLFYSNVSSVKEMLQVLLHLNMGCSIRV